MLLKIYYDRPSHDSMRLGLIWTKQHLMPDPLLVHFISLSKAEPSRDQDELKIRLISYKSEQMLADNECVSSHLIWQGTAEATL